MSARKKLCGQPGEKPKREIDPEVTDLFVRRVSNGWCVERHLGGREVFVASTPDDVASLLKRWAEGQQA